MASSETLTAEAPQPKTVEKPTLLIVDDEPGPRESLRIVFKDRYHCVIATCGREGIEFARTHTVDAAVLDFGSLGILILINHVLVNAVIQ